MLVPVRVAGAECAEWSVVELQGDLVSDAARLGASNSNSSSGSVTTDALADVDIGTLRFVDGVATLRVGNHVLSGKLAALPKPLAILQKTDSGGGGDGDGDGGLARTAGDEMGDAAAVCYEVVGIARSRLLFSTRPKPVLVE